MAEYQNQASYEFGPPSKPTRGSMSSPCTRSSVTMLLAGKVDFMSGECCVKGAKWFLVMLSWPAGTLNAFRKSEREPHSL
jgi:hypothetical protein